MDKPPPNIKKEKVTKNGKKFGYYSKSFKEEDWNKDPPEFTSFSLHLRKIKSRKNKKGISNLSDGYHN
jgi:hypothetical protein